MYCTVQSHQLHGSLTKAQTGDSTHWEAFTHNQIETYLLRLESYRLMDHIFLMAIIIILPCNQVWPLTICYPLVRVFTFNQRPLIEEDVISVPSSSTPNQKHVTLMTLIALLRRIKFSASDLTYRLSVGNRNAYSFKPTK